MKDKTSRREFLRNAALTAAALPVLFQGGSRTAQAMNGSSTDAPRDIKAKTKRIAVEEHWIFPAGKVPVVPEFSASQSLAFARLADFELRLPLMEESGITMQVLQPVSFLAPPTDRDGVIAWAKRYNDGITALVGKYPGRFAGYASLPIAYPKEAADELERAVTQLGLKRVAIAGSINGEYLDGQKFWPIWERAERLGVPIYLHPANPPLESRRMYEGHPELMGPAWSWTVDTATHALRIIGAGVFDAFPKSTVILGHMGESLPYLLARFDEGYAMFKNRKLKKVVSDYIKENIVITTSGKYNPEALVCAISAMGIDRVLFADDYPWVTPKEAVQQIERTPLSDLDKEKIYHLNAERWLTLS
ncbi:MAG TPA: amidohydrolase family protein [Syntrophorhabdales bacterium]|nr:amidohydrolase family protein [Syntrophorhabdales bacterium]